MDNYEITERISAKKIVIEMKEKWQKNGSHDNKIKRHLEGALPL